MVGSRMPLALLLSVLLMSYTRFCCSQRDNNSNCLGRVLTFTNCQADIGNPLPNGVLDKSAKYHLTSPITTVVIPTLYTLVFLFGLPSNGLGLLTLVLKMEKTPSTIFLMNLAMADLLVILMLPFKIHYHFLGNHWVFGEALCRTLTGLFYGNLYCSVLLLTAISIDRYLALVHPFFSRRFRDKSFAICTCAVIWVLVGVSLMPLLLQRQVYTFEDLNINTCHDMLPEIESDYVLYYFVCLVVLEFAIPCLIIIFCYTSIIRTLIVNKKKYARAAKITFLLLIAFLLCFAPSNITLLIHYSVHPRTHNHNIYLYYLICLALSSFNNCLDPFLYYYISDEFREKVRSLFRDAEGEHSQKTSHKLMSANTCSRSPQMASLPP
ncbi:proteinase-activated receptor 3, partial [Callorhinchus milii]|uniref:proteinase-activated receptor 3 n=1 Tax=Callorhinchus milii TaxID=7868 RepID=UPI0004573903